MHSNLKILLAYNSPESSKAAGQDKISEAAVCEEVDFVGQTLTEMGHTVKSAPFSGLSEIVSCVESDEPDMIFNLCEGLSGNSAFESNVAAVWELMNIPFTGNGSFALALAQKKAYAKKIMLADNIQTPRYELFTAAPEKTALKYPLFAKPSEEDASLGIGSDSVIDNFDSLKSKVAELLQKYRQPVLVEEFIDGREFNVSVLGGRNPKTLPVSEIDFSPLGPGIPKVTGYEAKWLPEHPLYQKTPSVCPAKISAALERKLSETALKVFGLLRGKDYGRVDFRVNASEEVFVLEYNPNPDISPSSGFVKSLLASGMTFRGFMEFLIDENMRCRK